ncbi:MAG: lipase, partial [Deltaproteobacteria bacterium]|nr:lipase [Deltaproteobacteria bacterium]
MAKLVALGDSLTQGFQSLAITRTDLAYPSMIAEAMGLAASEFAYPDFAGCGGLPCSIEWLARRLEATHGARITGLEWLAAARTLATYIDEVEAYWERGPGTHPTPDVLFHNLAVWGFEVADSYRVTPALCAAALRGTKDNWFKPPSEPRLRTALRVLDPARNPARATDTQLSIAKKIRDRDGGIEHLIAWYGANNCLRTVVQLELNETGDAPPGVGSAFTLWSPRAFEAEYVKLAGELAALGATHTYVATVPHVTIPPVTRG